MKSIINLWNVWDIKTQVLFLKKGYKLYIVNSDGIKFDIKDWPKSETFCIGDQKITIPSYPVSRDEEESIKYHPSSGLNNPEHAIRKAIDGRREKAEYAVEEVDPEATEEFAAEVQAAAEEAPTVESGGDE